jgi:hypothetical protein
MIGAYHGSAGRELRLREAPAAPRPRAWALDALDALDLFPHCHILARSAVFGPSCGRPASETITTRWWLR